VVGLADHRHIPEILDKITGITPIMCGYDPKTRKP
jgi:hypothetical protein